MFNTFFQLFFGAKTQLMPVRYDLLRDMLPAYYETGLPFLAKTADGQFKPLLNADDVGLYILVPKLMQLFHLSLDDAISLFFNGMSIGGLLIGSISCIYLFNKNYQRVIAVGYLLILTKVTTGALDLYRVPAALAIATIPWALYLLQRNLTKSAYAFLFLLGIAAGCANFIRAHAGVAALLFAITLLIAQSYKSKRIGSAAIGLGFLFAGLTITYGYFMYANHRYEKFVKAHAPDHTDIHQFHGFWHPALGGLGYLNNEYGLSYLDGAIAKKVAERNASWTRESSPEYERVAKAEYMDIVRKNPWFVITTYAAKSGVLLFYLILFANIGLLAAWYRPLPWQVLLAFAVALGWSALPGIIAIPITSYLYGFIAFAGLFGLISFNYAIAK